MPMIPMTVKIIMVRAHPVNPDVRIEKEATSLSEAGYEVTILCWGRHGAKTQKLEKRLNYKIRRFRFPAPLGARVIFSLPLWWLFELVWLLRNEWDVVHAADFDTILPALIAAKIKQKKVIYDIFDFYADQAPLPRMFRMIVASLDRYVMNYADTIIIVDPSRLKQIRREQDDSVIILYNSPSDTLIFNSNINAKGENIFRIFYAGGLSRDRDIFSILIASAGFDDVYIEIAGYGDYEAELKRIIGSKPRMSFLGLLPYNKVLEKSHQADLLFALYDPGVANNRYASPNKLFEAMMCGKPILVSDETAMAHIVREEDCGFVVPYGDVDAIKSAIRTLKSDPALCKRLGANGRKAYETKYGWNIMEKRLLDIYQTLSKTS